MSEESNEKSNSSQAGQIIAAGSILGVGIGAAIGSATGDLSTGIWIGAVIGVGAAFLFNALRGG